jgi:hypothetical protein
MFHRVPDFIGEVRDGVESVHAVPWLARSLRALEIQSIPAPATTHPLNRRHVVQLG